MFGSDATFDSSSVIVPSKPGSRMKPAVEWMSSAEDNQADFLPSRRATKSSGSVDPLVGGAEHELAGVEDERLGALDLDELGQVLLRVAHVDEGGARVVEHAEEAVDAQVDARGLYERLVVRVDGDAPSSSRRRIVRSERTIRAILWLRRGPIPTRWPDSSSRSGSYELGRLEQEVSSGFTRVTTLVRLRGRGEEGIGEDVTYTGEDHPPPADLAAHRHAHGRLVLRPVGRSRPVHARAPDARLA